MGHALRPDRTSPMNLPKGPGVFASQHLLEAIDEGIISAGDFLVPPENVQPASLDLRLDEVAYRIQCSFLAGTERVDQKMKDLIIDEIQIHKEGAVLETHRPYLIPLKERVSLPKGVRAWANPKSSTGRLDVFTRVITDGGSKFDDIREGYDGRLYLEVVPLSFPIRVRENLTLNQLRLSIGNPTLDDRRIRAAYRDAPILFGKNGEAISERELPLSNGLFLSLDLEGDRRRRIGYQARGAAPPP